MQTLHAHSILYETQKSLPCDITMTLAESQHSTYTYDDTIRVHPGLAPDGLRLRVGFASFAVSRVVVHEGLRVAGTRPQPRQVLTEDSHDISTKLSTRMQETCQQTLLVKCTQHTISCRCSGRVKRQSDVALLTPARAPGIPVATRTQERPGRQRCALIAAFGEVKHGTCPRGIRLPIQRQGRSATSAVLISQ